eukprot:3289615-Pleurochrysis_carterae.AAC.1
MSLRSVASMSSGAMMYRFDSSAVSGGRPEPETVEAGAEAGVADAAAAACDCDRGPWVKVNQKYGARGDGTGNAVHVPCCKLQRCPAM